MSQQSDRADDVYRRLSTAEVGNAEASSLRWKDVGFKRGQIRLYRHKTDTGFVIPIYPQVLPLLERLQKKYGQDPKGKVFPIADAKKSLDTACKALKLGHYTHRSLRRMFIIRAIEKGIDVKVIAEWQGHRDGGKLLERDVLKM